MSSEIFADRDSFIEGVPAGNCCATDVPGGEWPSEIGARADRVVGRVRDPGQGSDLSKRADSAGWLPMAGEYCLLSTASLSALSYEQDLARRTIELWNAVNHVGA
jgi:hypothetical protein